MAKRYIADKFEGGEFIGVNSATITTAVSITNATLTDLGYTQQGKVVKIDNGAYAINYTVNAGITASFVKGGTGAITFVQGAGRTLVSNSGSFVWNGLVNGTVQISSFGTTDILTFVSQSLYPAPFIDIIVPDSTLPSTTGNFELYGAFFKEDMVVTFTGQTVNYIIFHSDNHISVNVTTGATEGLFSITLNNGISKTFANAYMVVLGTVYIPSTADWTVISGSVDTSTDGELKLTTYNSINEYKWVKPLNYLINFSVTFTIKRSPLGIPLYRYNDDMISIRRISDNVPILFMGYQNTISWRYKSILSAAKNITGNFDTDTFEFRWYGGVLSIRKNGALVVNLSDLITENCYLYFQIRDTDYSNIKYIELA